MNLPDNKGLGDLIEILAKPVAQVLNLNCLDDKGQLRPESNCARRKRMLNRIFPAKKAQVDPVG